MKELGGCSYDPANPPDPRRLQNFRDVIGERALDEDEVDDAPTMGRYGIGFRSDAQVDEDPTASSSS